MICSNCGMDIASSTARYCEYCGSPLYSAENPQRQSAPTPSEAPLETAPETPANSELTPGKKPPKKSHAGVVAGVVVALAVLCAIGVFVVFGLDAERPAEPESAPPVEIDKSGFLGSWELKSGTSEGLEKENVDLLREMGLTVTLEFRDDGKGTFSLFGEESTVFWDVLSDTEGSMEWNNSSVQLTLEEDELEMENENGETMSFTKGNESAVTNGDGESIGLAGENAS